VRDDGVILTSPIPLPLSNRSAFRLRLSIRFHRLPIDQRRKRRTFHRFDRSIPPGPGLALWVLITCPVIAVNQISSAGGIGSPIELGLYELRA
jgi:hypothetical protein